MLRNVKAGLTTRSKMRKFDLAGAKVYAAGGLPYDWHHRRRIGPYSCYGQFADQSARDGIAAAFVATIYGMGFANLVFLPVGNRLKAIVADRCHWREMVIQGVTSIAQARIPVISKPDWEATSATNRSRRRRRRYSLPDDDSGRWMVSYADFMTLLFAFFVVMYATVSGDGDTLKKLHDLAARVEQSISGSNTPSAEDVRTSADVQGMAAVLRQVASAYGDGALEPEVEPGEIAITISSHVLFASGDAQIAHAAMPLLSI